MGKRTWGSTLVLMLTLAGFGMTATSANQQTLAAEQPAGMRPALVPAAMALADPAKPSVPAPAADSKEYEKVIDLDCGSGVKMKLVLISAGEFMMGGEESPEQISRKCIGGPPMQGNLGNLPEAFQNEQPRQLVKIDAPFYMGIHCVTQAQYNAVMGAHPAHFKEPTRPVEMVSWNDAVQFCRTLSEKTGRTVRLPTEAEWEYACRAGTNTAFNTGATISVDKANYNGSGVYGTGDFGGWRQTTTPVGSFPANGWGLYDMHGNVWQWCSSLYKAYPYVSNDGREDETVPGNRVIRGGSWAHAPFNARSAKRFGNPQSVRLHDVGFRVVAATSMTASRASTMEAASANSVLPPRAAEQVRVIVMAQVKAFLPPVEQGAVVISRIEKGTLLSVTLDGRKYSAKVFRPFLAASVNSNEFDAKEYYVKTLGAWELKGGVLIPDDTHLSGIISSVTGYDADTITAQDAAIARSDAFCKAALDQLDPERKAKAATVTEAHKADMDALTKQITQLKADVAQKEAARNAVAAQIASNPPKAPVTTRDADNKIIWQWSPGQGITFYDGLDQARQKLDQVTTAQKTLQAATNAEVTVALGLPGAKENAIRDIFKKHRRRILIGDMTSDDEMRADYESLLTQPLKVPPASGKNGIN